ncbi:MAG: aminotransferase class I/II-fold pyridoxal phosphate-dependent enzyme [Candidatus Peregrinibacteria bacterium]|nr:aminotransferase class I/II-fold pyridoxal phosphate-dependent enzyme [Candidatus Peregrinibacteria bacterium]
MRTSTPPPPAYLRSLIPYSSARSILKGEGWTFLDASESPVLCPSAGANAMNRYPDPTCDTLRDAIADRFALMAANICVTSGIDELIELAIRAFSAPGSIVASFDPTYALYRVSAQASGRTYTSIPLTNSFSLPADAAAAASPADVVFLCSPNNPTGTVLELPAVEEIIAQAKGIVVIDEAYGEFADRGGYTSGLSFVQRGAKNVIVARTFSKAYGGAGLRLGYGIACPEIIDQLLKVKPPYNVSSLSQTLGLALWREEEWMRANVETLCRECERVSSACRALGCDVTESVTHFFLLTPPADMDAGTLYTRLRDEYCIVVRPIGEINGRASLRVSMGTAEQNDLFLSALSTLMPFPSS